MYICLWYKTVQFYFIVTELNLQILALLHSDIWQAKLTNQTCQKIHFIQNHPSSNHPLNVSPPYPNHLRSQFTISFTTSHLLITSFCFCYFSTSEDWKITTHGKRWHFVSVAVSVETIKGKALFKEFAIRSLDIKFWKSIEIHMETNFNWSRKMSDCLFLGSVYFFRLAKESRKQEPWQLLLQQSSTRTATTQRTFNLFPGNNSFPIGNKIILFSDNILWKSITLTRVDMKLYPNEKTPHTSNHIYRQVERCSSYFELPDGIVNIKCWLFHCDQP